MVISRHGKMILCMFNTLLEQHRAIELAPVDDTVGSFFLARQATPLLLSNGFRIGVRFLLSEFDGEFAR